MDLKLRKDLTSNWFKMLQDAICNDVLSLEGNKSKFVKTSWKRN